MGSMKADPRIIIKSGGEMASGIAVRLYRAGFRNIVMLETPHPLAVRRAVSFCEAVHDREQRVEGIVARRADHPEGIRNLWQNAMLAVAVDPEWALIPRLAPEITIDAVLAKRNLGTAMDEAPLVMALGPGFTAGRDAHYVIETNRGHDLGRVYATGSAQPDTGIPGDIGGYTKERVLRAPVDGIVKSCREIGTSIRAGEAVCTVGGVPVLAAIDGIVRGCVRPGTRARAGLKLGDVDPRGRPEYCVTVSEKARALGGAVLEVICAHLNR